MPFIGNQPTQGRFIELDSLTASATDDYTLQLNGANFSPESVNNLLVSINGVIQGSSTMSLNGAVLTVGATLSSSDTIDFVRVFGNVGTVSTPTDGSVTANKIGTGAVTSAKIADDAVVLTSKVSGVLPVANGGIGATSYVFVYAQGTNGYVTGSTGDFLPLTAVYQHKGTGNADYNTSTYKYTAPVNGIYQINLSLIVQATNVSTHYELNVDGTNVYVYAWSSGGRDSDGSTSIYLDAGQVVGFRNGNNAGYYRHSASLPSNDHYTVASFCLLREL